MRRATPPRRPSPLRAGRGTQALGALAVGATLATVGLEWARVWRRGSAPVPSETDHLLSAGRTATRETLAVMREGYRAGADRENAVFTMLAAFTLTFGGARATTMMIRTGRGRGVLGNFIVGDRHIHHFVPGMLLALVSGGAAIATRGDTGERWLAVPFGAGAALVFDEAALLLELEDVYWNERGVLSVQLSFGAIALLASLALSVRLLRRGETFVLPQPAAVPPGR